MLQMRDSMIYGIHVPLSDFLVVGCKEAGCQNYRNGFQVKLLLGQNDDFMEKAYYGITHSKMKYVETTTADGWTVLTFEAGQMCFKGLAGQHRKRKENAREVFYSRNGLTGDTRRHVRPVDWIEDSALTLDRWATLRKRG
jgi:hypothetical protein